MIRALQKPAVRPNIDSDGFESSEKVEELTSLIQVMASVESLQLSALPLLRFIFHTIKLKVLRNLSNSILLASFFCSVCEDGDLNDGGVPRTELPGNGSLLAEATLRLCRLRLFAAECGVVSGTLEGVG